ncbi:hypothetical protein UlMin_030759 [Ulmus minor]
MKSRKAIRPDDIPIEAWKELEIQWLTRLFNRVLKIRKMSDLWRHNINKGDIQNCSNYRGIKLMSHTLKLWERIKERRLKSLITVSNNQFEHKNLHMAFIDLEKAYNRVPMELIWWVLERKKMSQCYVDIINDMYEGVA